MAWILTLAFILIIHFFIKAEPLLLMILFITSTFLTLKIVVANNHLSKEDQLTYGQWLLFCYGWFGMNPRPFLAFPSRALPGYHFYLIKGVTRILLGLLLINSTGFIDGYLSTTRFAFILHLLYLIGLSLILHFGVLNIFAGFLRRLGINVTSLFKDPIRSKSLSEFWSKRWNLAFVELTTIAVLRPIKSKYGAKAAFWTSFIFSGLLHELAISLPVKSGFGKPFAYFIMQAVLIMSIDTYFIKKQSNNFIRTFVLLACLFLPIFLLFHKQFVLQIVLPLVNYLKIV